MNTNEPYITKVYLLDVPLENNYRDTLIFSSQQDQYNYFLSKQVLTYGYENFSYQRKDNVIRFPIHIDTLRGKVNYVMYQNTYYDNKWFYAFITDMRYINDGCTEIQIETDVLQTWMFDYTIHQSFIEREHTNDDTVGKNTVPEGLETGDYICVGEQKVTTIFDKANCLPVVSVTELYSDIASGLLHQVTPDIPQGTYYIMCQDNVSAKGVIAYYDDNGKGDSVNSVFLVPKELFDQDSQFWETKTLTFKDGSTWTVTINKSPLYQKTQSIGLSSLNTILGNNYTPRNYKLLCHPYRYLQITNNSGDCKNYQYELFSNPISTSQSFTLNGAITPSCSYRLFPINYKNMTSNADEGITFGKLPIGAWQNDIYTNWLTQNALNLSTAIEQQQFNLGMNVANASIQGADSVIQGLIGGIGGLASGKLEHATSSIASGVTGTMSSIANGIQQGGNNLYEIQKINATKVQHSFTPPSARGNTNSGDCNYSGNLLSPIARQMAIKGEYAKIIDDYFDLYGYQTNLVKTPNTWHRQEWWYTKTINANITGSIPDDDITKIRGIYDTGVRFWTDPDHIYNYGLSNPIV